MALAPYRAVLAVPGVRSLTALLVLARIPVSAIPIVLTLHVVLDLGRGYADAGVVGAALTIGACLGGPVLGRIADRNGMRTMLTICTICEGGFWLASPLLPYPALLIGAFVGGFAGIPTTALSRQALAALVPAELRRLAYSLDSISAELSFMIGPALGVVIVTAWSGTSGLLALSGTILGTGIALWVANPPTRSALEKLDTAVVHWRAWASPALSSLLVTAAGATIALAGADMAIVAALRPTGQLGWVGAVNTALCLASAAGGLVFGARSWHLPARLGMMLLGLLEIPAGLASGHWWLLALALMPAAALCAATVTAIGDELSRIAPAGVRGLVMGLQGSAFTLGGAIGAPLAGIVADHYSPSWGFAVVGATGVTVATCANLLTRGQSRRPVESALVTP